MLASTVWGYADKSFRIMELLFQHMQKVNRTGLLVSTPGSAVGS